MAKLAVGVDQPRDGRLAARQLEIDAPDRAPPLGSRPRSYPSKKMRHEPSTEDGSFEPPLVIVLDQAQVQPVRDCRAFHDWFGFQASRVFERFGEAPIDRAIPTHQVLPPPAGATELPIDAISKSLDPGSVGELLRHQGLDDAGGTRRRGSTRRRGNRPRIAFHENLTRQAEVAQEVLMGPRPCRYSGCRRGIAR